MLLSLSYFSIHIQHVHWRVLLKLVGLFLLLTLSYFSIYSSVAAEWLAITVEEIIATFRATVLRSFVTG